MITKEKLSDILKKTLRFILNPRLLLCLGIAWFITNGWSYVMLALGTWLKSGWMIGIASSYLAALWAPFTPEKIVTVIIAIWLLKLLFPKDEKTLAVLYEMRDSIKRKIAEEREKRREKKALRCGERVRKSTGQNDPETSQNRAGG